MTARLSLQFLVFSILAVTLAACGPSSKAEPESLPAAAQSDVGLTQEDVQGAVTVAVTPLNLDNPGDILEFAVAMNTHSVELSMDLVELASLTTDTGLTAAPLTWEAPSSGHHVSGILAFPSNVDGQDFLNGATQLTLSIRDVDASERLFIWQIES